MNVWCVAEEVGLPQKVSSWLLSAAKEPTRDEEPVFVDEVAEAIEDGVAMVVAGADVVVPSNESSLWWFWQQPSGACARPPSPAGSYHCTM